MVWTDATMPPFNIISIRSTPEIVPSYKKLQAGWQNIGNELTRFLMGTIFLVLLLVTNCPLGEDTCKVNLTCHFTHWLPRQHSCIQTTGYWDGMITFGSTPTNFHFQQLTCGMIKPDMIKLFKGGVPPRPCKKIVVC